MPDLFNVFARRWKMILLLTLIAALVAFGSSFLSPEKYLSTATDLPVNVMVNERSRIFVAACIAIPGGAKTGWYATCRHRSRNHSDSRRPRPGAPANI